MKIQQHEVKTGIYLVQDTSRYLLVDAALKGETLEIISARPREAGSADQWPMEAISQILHHQQPELPHEFSVRGKAFRISSPRDLLDPDIVERNLNANAKRRVGLDEREIDVFLGWQAMWMRAPA